MKALYTTALTVVVGAAAQIAAPRTACARDTLVVNLGVRSVTLAPADVYPAVTPQADASTPLDALKSDPVRSSAAAAAAVVPLIETEAAPGETVQLEIEDPRFDFPNDAACGESCPPKPLNLQLLPREIMRNIDQVPVLDAMVTPVTTGVTLEPLEGLPPVTITVKPGKITRGGGVIAITRF
jgi:hypothetical protein